MWKIKKAQMAAIQGLVLGLVVVGLVLAIGFVMLQQLNTQAVAIGGASSYADNATEAVLGALDDVPGWLPVVVIAIIGSIIFSVIYMFARRQ